MAARVCIDCPAVGNWTRGRCPDHDRARDAARGWRERAGKSSRHDAERARIKRRLNAGERIPCARCGQPISHDFHLDHDSDRSKFLGPSHPKCNLRAAGLASHGLEWSSPNSSSDPGGGTGPVGT